MPRYVTQIEIFVSSPSDLSKERQIVRRVVEELNRSHWRDQYFFVALLYEDEVPPEVGADELPITLVQSREHLGR